jgi:hypothetical protein
MMSIWQGGIARKITNVFYNGAPGRRATIEIETLTKVISFLTNEVESKGEILDVEKERNFKKKINDRFAEYEQGIKTEYALLLPDYADKYALAWHAADISEDNRDKVDRLLSIKSLRFLDNAGGNPLLAIDMIVDWLKQEIGSNHQHNQEGFSEMATRFFVYKEFARCNVFPNLKNEE